MYETQAEFPVWTGRIQIPATGGALKTIATLLTDAGCPFGSEAKVVRILGTLADGTQRGAIWTTVPRVGFAIAATDFTAEGTRWAADADAYEPGDRFREMFVAGVAGAINNVNVVAMR